MFASVKKYNRNSTIANVKTQKWQKIHTTLYGSRRWLSKKCRWLSKNRRWLYEKCTSLQKTKTQKQLNNPQNRKEAQTRKIRNFNEKIGVSTHKNITPPMKAHNKITLEILFYYIVVIHMGKKYKKIIYYNTI